jgi:hypothetical protein
MDTDLIIDGSQNENATEETVEETTTEATEETMEAAADDAGQEPETPAYEPDFKFKVKDKELEFDEWLRPVVKDKETEEKVRDILTKAHGIDELKTTRDTLKADLETIRTEKQRQDQALGVVESYIKNKDYRSFFDALGIPKADVIRYAVEELKFQEMTPEQQAVVQQQWQEKNRLATLETQNQSLQQQQQQLVQQQAEFELNSQLSKSDVSQIAAAYDARVGTPGAFRQEVINRGAYHEAVSGKVISAEQAIQEVMSLVGGSVQAQPESVPQTPQGHASVQKTKPVIPNIQGTAGTSPAKRIPKSIEDLRKMRDQMLQG